VEAAVQLEEFPEVLQPGNEINFLLPIDYRVLISIRRQQWSSTMLPPKKSKTTAVFSDEHLLTGSFW
jgi:hypothetical protein